METWQIVLIVIASVIAFLGLFVVLPGVIFTMPIAKNLYNKQWKRQNADHFKRGCSDESVDFHLDMYNQGLAYRESVKEHIKEVEIERDGIKLVGEFYDFGFDKTIMLCPGRAETVCYGAYYAPTYIAAGYNVLLTDPRAHGLSGGDKITLGKEEGLDVLAWCKYLHDELHCENIYLYGLCGGGTAVTYALTRENRPDYFKAIILDGTFYSFFRCYRRHIIYEKHPVYPVIWELFHLVKKYNGVSAYKVTPYRLVKHVDLPTLFLTGENDIFAINKDAYQLFKLSPAKDKKVVLIHGARHSHLRYDNTKEYEDAVIPWLKSH